MIGKVAVIAAILFIGVPMVFGQTAKPASLQYFTLTGSATGFLQNGNASTASTAGASLQLTPSLAIGYSQVMIPAKASYRLGTVNFSKPLSSLLGKRLSSKFVFDISQVGVTFQAGAGKQLQNGNVPSHVAEVAGVALYYPLASHLSLQVLGYQYVHSSVSGFIKTNGQQAISTGFAVKF
jgi:hypothetical protein